ncbi:beta-lactamase/transpeptidase-like protein [Lophium mytilinum]|uniref:Beta-lactamase/transpeptidase-like protein n=1 Tax=Lophium mytilinum TaxID=390894 RepID=A0A6A6RF22_9PEZI|nr:beta-lactamase/transpeptidase-like protein [Lophium mytilinum]
MHIYSLLTLVPVLSLVNAACYHPSPAFPLPELDPSDPILRAAFTRINAAASLLVAAPEFDGHSYSIEVTSSKQSLWSAHHTAREKNKDGRGVDEVDGDTLYRIASITKTFTVLGLLYEAAAGNLSLDDTVDMYLSDLSGKRGGQIPWKDITLRSLASQLSGIPREFAQSDLLNSLKDPASWGLPPVDRKGLVKCDEYADYHPPCDVEDLIDSITSKPPLFAPNQRSTYSNVAFELLGLVIANTSQSSYISYIQEAIFKPLSMSRSALTKPPDSHGIIPNGFQFWDIDLGVQAPTGAIYSSTSDLSKFLRYILNHYNGITHATNWLQPASWAEGLQSFYGMPWEIFRTDEILASRRPVTFATKSGGLPGYSSLIFLLQEYDIGITILDAGGRAPLLFKLRDIVTVEVVRALEEVALKQLERYTGDFVATEPTLNSSLTLSVDQHGLTVTHFVSNGTDMLDSVVPKFPGIEGPWRAQLTPTLLFRDEAKQEGELWRLQVVPEKTEGGSIWDNFCVTDIDSLTYGGLPLQEFVFWEDDEGVVEGLDLSAFRLKMRRQVDSTGQEDAQAELR